MDQFDQAQDLDARYRQQALVDQRRRAAIGGESRMRCIDCGEEIPQKRRDAYPGCIRCRNCAELSELSQRRG